MRNNVLCFETAKKRKLDRMSAAKCTDDSDFIYQYCILVEVTGDQKVSATFHNDREEIPDEEKALHLRTIAEAIEGTHAGSDDEDLYFSGNYNDFLFDLDPNEPPF